MSRGHRDFLSGTRIILCVGLVRTWCVLNHSYEGKGKAVVSVDHRKLDNK